MSTLLLHPSIIFKALGDAEMTIDDLVNKIRAESPAFTSMIIRESILPLIVNEQIDWTDRHQLRRR